MSFICSHLYKLGKGEQTS